MRIRLATLAAGVLLATTALMQATPAQTPGLTITWGEDDGNPRTWIYEVHFVDLEIGPENYHAPDDHPTATGQRFVAEKLAAIVARSQRRFVPRRRSMKVLRAHFPHG